MTQCSQQYLNNDDLQGCNMQHADSFHFLTCCCISVVSSELLRKAHRPITLLSKNYDIIIYKMMKKKHKRYTQHKSIESIHEAITVFRHDKSCPEV